MVHLICGKICSGKSVYAKSLAREENAVILSCDEVTYDLFDNDLGTRHDEMSRRLQAYLLKKAVQIARAGTDVILEWGFWSEQDREAATAYFASANIPVRWHYIHVSDEQWKANIASRNAAVLAGTSPDYFVDDGLLLKLASRFEEPAKERIDVWYERSE